MNLLHLDRSRELERESSDWLRRLSPSEWIRAALGELSRANDALSRGQSRAALAGCKRAAGMALNGALLVAPNAAWGRSYLEHLGALAYDSTVPDPVRRACSTVLRARAADPDVVDKAYDVIAHAWFVVQRSERWR